MMSAASLAVLGFVAIFGLLIGSFLNVVVYRTPRACMSVWRQARSRCPHCAVQLRWHDNVPVVSWLWLRARCFRCAQPISMRYPLVEVATAAIYVGLLWFDLGSPETWPLAGWTEWSLWAAHALVAATLLALSLIDYDFRILPDRITLPSIVIAPLLVFCVPALMPEPVWTPMAQGSWAPNVNGLANGVLGALGAGLTLLFIGWGGSKLFRKDAMGLGDVKLMAGMGGLLGIWALFALLVACFAGAAIGIVVMLVKKDRYMPFGPFLAFGTMAATLRGPRLLDELAELLAMQ